MDQSVLGDRSPWDGVVYGSDPSQEERGGTGWSPFPLRRCHPWVGPFRRTGGLRL